jgi:hypothetical protein
VDQHFHQNHTARIIPLSFRPSLKKLPPYGRDYLSKSPLVEGAWILAGSEAWREAWRYRDNGATVMVMPDDDSPSDYRWPVSQEFVTIFQAGCLTEEKLTQLARELLYSGNARAVFFHGEYGLRHFRRASPHGN